MACDTGKRYRIKLIQTIINKTILFLWTTNQNKTMTSKGFVNRKSISTILLCWLLQYIVQYCFYRYRQYFSNNKTWISELRDGTSINSTLVRETNNRKLLLNRHNILVMNVQGTRSPLTLVLLVCACLHLGYNQVLINLIYLWVNYKHQYTYHQLPT